MPYATSQLRSGFPVSPKADLLLGDSVTQWQEHRPYIQSELGSNPAVHSLAVTLALTVNQCSSVSSSVTGTMLPDPLPNVPVDWVTEHMDTDQYSAWHTGGTHYTWTPFHFFQYRFFLITLRLKPEVLVAQWTGPSWQEGAGMVQLALKRWLNCPTMEIHIINLSPQMFYLALRPRCACIPLPPWTWGSTLLSHRETGRPSSLPRAASCALCPRMAMSQEQGAAQCPEIYENTHVKKGVLCRERSCGQAWCMGAIRAGLQQLSAVLFNCLKNCHSNSSHT